MESTIQLLLKLQDIDSMIAELSKKTILVPKRLGLHKTELDEVEGQVEENENRLRALDREKRKFEGEVEEIENATVRFQNQLNRIKTNEEYRALLSQIKRSTERQEICEDKILSVMESIEQTEGLLSEKKNQLDAAQELYRKREGDAKSLMEKLKEGIEAKTAERKHAAADLDKTYLKQYERILAGKDGLAVSPIEANVCSGCHGAIPPQFINEIRKVDKLYTCQHCGRILVWRP